MIRKFNIIGLNCANCAQKIEEVAAHEKGVKNASLNFIQKTLTLELDEVAEKNITTTIRKLEAIETGVQILDETVEEVKRSSNTLLRIAFSLIIFLIAQLYFVGLFQIAGFILSYLIVGYRVLKQAFKNIIKKDLFDENFLMSIATIGAFAIQSYEEAVAVMIFYEVGELFQTYAIEKSRKSIAALMDLKVEVVNVLEEGKLVSKQPDLVKIDDIMVVNVGERIALDGIIVRGRTRFDTSAISGESVPVNAGVGDEALSGVVNVEGSIEIKVTKLLQDSTLTKILDLVENASSKKADTERFITRFAKVYTPIVVISAILLFLIFQIGIAPDAFNDNLYRSLTFLVISCPCALVISIPLGMFAGIGTASMCGVLIKGGNYLEALSKVDTIVFDKTGTLTKGSFAIIKIVCNNFDELELLKIAAHVEANSNHPIAISIRNKYAGVIDRNLVSDSQEVAGMGLTAIYNQKVVLVGNDLLMNSNNISGISEDSGKTNIHIALGDRYIGRIVIADEIRDTSIKAISELRKQNIDKMIMLSGDRSSVGKAISLEVGLNEGYYEMLPADKVNQMQKIMENAHTEKNSRVAYVGDGINDAPVLAMADVGISMGKIGSDAAIEASDIVLMRDDPLAINDAIKIAKRTMRNVSQNIVFSLLIKVVFLILSTLSMVNMWMGVFADVGVTLIAILNSMRIFTYVHKRRA